MNRIIKFVMLDILRNKIILFYTLLLAIMSFSMFSLEDNEAKGLLSLLNLILLNVPLVAITFSTIYIYNSSEFIELLISQPIKRNKIWISLYLGLNTSLIISFIIGAGIPILLYSPNLIGIILIVMGCIISVIFTSLAFLCSIIARDKAKGIGMSILIWLFFSLLFDGLIMFLLFQLADYPMENWIAIIAALNPIDLSRIVILLQLDLSAMLGFTGAVFKQTFGTGWGIFFSSSLLFLWMIIPFMISLRKFNKKDH